MKKGVIDQVRRCDNDTIKNENLLIYMLIAKLMPAQCK